jgi:hypothetical protein
VGRLDRVHEREHPWPFAVAGVILAGTADNPAEDFLREILGEFPLARETQEVPEYPEVVPLKEIAAVNHRIVVVRAPPATSSTAKTRETSQPAENKPCTHEQTANADA